MCSVDLYYRPVDERVFYRYDKARQIKNQQDAYCSAALAGRWAGLGEFPEDLQWEALVDVLRGRVRVCVSPCLPDQNLVNCLLFQGSDALLRSRRPGRPDTSADI